jgi:6-phosphofructokinase 1
MRIGILTSGGDAPGMNAVLAGAARAGAVAGHHVLGIESGFAGLVQRRTRQLDFAGLRDTLNRAGTFLGTSRWPRLRSAEGVAEATRAVKALDLDRLVIVGGAGSLAGAASLAEAGVPVVGVPATIDGDTRYPTATIGMDSAVNFGVRAIDDLRATATALPGRAFLVETLGGDTGHLAVAVAEASCCPIVLTPEQPWDPAEVAGRMRDEVRDGYSIAILGEGVGFAADIARVLEVPFGGRIRPTTLGHGMRGAQPSARDRRLGLLAGEAAIGAAERGAESTVLVLDKSAGVGILPIGSAAGRTS